MRIIIRGYKKGWIPLQALRSLLELLFDIEPIWDNKN